MIRKVRVFSRIVTKKLKFNQKNLNRNLNRRKNKNKNQIQY